MALWRVPGRGVVENFLAGACRRHWDCEVGAVNVNDWTGEGRDGWRIRGGIVALDA